MLSSSLPSVQTHRPLQGALLAAHAAAPAFIKAQHREQKVLGLGKQKGALLTPDRDSLGFTTRPEAGRLCRPHCLTLTTLGSRPDHAVGLTPQKQPPSLQESGLCRLPSAQPGGSRAWLRESGMAVHLPASSTGRTECQCWRAVFSAHRKHLWPRGGSTQGRG